MPDFVNRPEIKSLVKNKVQYGAKVFMGDDFSHLDLSLIDFRGSTFINVNFKDCYLFLTVFSKCNIENTSFENADLEAAQFTKATLNKVSFRNAYLKVTNFSMATLNIADFSFANLSDTLLLPDRFDGIVLSGAKYDDGTAWPRWDKSGIFKKPFVPEKYGAVKE